MTDELLGDRIIKQLKKNNITTSDLAGKLLISEEDLNNYITHQKEPSPQVIYKLSEIFNVPKNYFLNCCSRITLKEMNIFNKGEKNLDDRGEDLPSLKNYGTEFENFIKNRIESLNSEIKVFQNVKIFSCKLNKSTEIDLLVITPWRVYCIEAKRVRSRLIGEYTNKVWTTVSGRYQKKIYNPIVQNLLHVRALKRELLLRKIYLKNIEPLWCIPDKVKCDISYFKTVSQLLLVISEDSYNMEHRINVSKLSKVIYKIGYSDRR